MSVVNYPIFRGGPTHKTSPSDFTRINSRARPCADLGGSPWNRTLCQQVSAVVCWRIDRLGRTAKGLTSLFADLQEKRVNLVSIKDGLDLSTQPADSWQMFSPVSHNSRQRYGPKKSLPAKPQPVPPARFGVGENPAGGSACPRRKNGQSSYSTNKARESLKFPVLSASLAQQFIVFWADLSCFASA